MSDPDGKHKKTARNIIVVTALVMLVIHKDIWFWDDRTLVFGVVPVGLMYHGIFSLLCGVLWASAVKFAWPSGIERWATEGDTPATTPAGAADGDGAAAGTENAS